MAGSTVIPMDNHRVFDAGNPYTNTWVSNICLLRGIEKNVISDEMKLFYDMKCLMF